MVSAVAGAVSVILSPEDTDFALEIVNVPVVPEAAKATVPKLVPLSANVNVVEAVAAVVNLQTLVDATPLYVPVPPAGTVPAIGEKNVPST